MLTTLTFHSARLEFSIWEEFLLFFAIIIKVAVNRLLDHLITFFFRIFLKISLKCERT